MPEWAGGWWWWWWCIHPPPDDDDDDDNKSIFIIFFPCRAMSVASRPCVFFGVRWSWNEMKKKLDRFPDGYIECQLPTMGLDHIRSGSQCFFFFWCMFEYVCTCSSFFSLHLPVKTVRPDLCMCVWNCEPLRIIYYNHHRVPSARVKTRISTPMVVPQCTSLQQYIFFPI